MNYFDCDIYGQFYDFLLEDSYNNFLIYEKLIGSDTLKNFIQKSFHSKMISMWERVLTVELNSSNIDGLLKGTSPEAKFDYFVTELQKQENLSALLEKYPSLWSDWQSEIEICITFLKITIQRIVNDLDKASLSLYGTNAIEKIVHIECLGDPHNGMQRTVRVVFTSNGGVEHVIFLKPRSLAIDEGFSRFVSWWNCIGPIDHRVPRVFNCGSYGWAEAIEYAACQSKEETAKYFRRYGSLIALTYMFATTDIHVENLVAAGEFPVIVDTETLFSCTFETKKHLSSNYHMYASLMLPVYVMYETIEVSPLSWTGAHQGAVEGFVNPQKRDSGLRFHLQKLKLARSENDLLNHKQPIDFLIFKEDIITGMKETLSFIMANKNSVIEELDLCMSNASVRIIVRGTEEYGKILHNIYHPNCLREKDRDRKILEITKSNLIIPILETEIAELKRGDIPYFQMDYDSSVLMTGMNKKIDVNIYHSPRDKLIYQLNRLNSDLIENSLSDLEHAFVIYNARIGKSRPVGGRHYTELSHVPDASWLDELAINVLTNIKAQAVFLEDSYSWRTMALNADNTIATDLNPTDLYQGIVGVALAYYTVGSKLRLPKFLDFAGQLSDQTIRTLEQQTTAELGSFAGTAGILWALAVINQERLVRLLPLLEKSIGHLSIRLISDQYQTFKSIDYMNGAAGTLSMLVRCHALYRKYPIANKLQKLMDFTFRLVKEHSKKFSDQKETYFGFAHGTAGTSASLAEYMTYMEFTDAQAQKIILNNTMRENLFKSENTWPRREVDETRDTSWCHGTVGIGISRLLCRPYLPSAIIEADVSSVVAKLGVPKQSLCACHGLMGDYYFSRMAGLSAKTILRQIRCAVEENGIRTDLGLNGLEMIGAINGVTSLFVGDSIFGHCQFV